MYAKCGAVPSVVKILNLALTRKGDFSDCKTYMSPFKKYCCLSRKNSRHIQDAIKDDITRDYHSTLVNPIFSIIFRHSIRPNNTPNCQFHHIKEKESVLSQLALNIIFD